MKWQDPIRTERHCIDEPFACLNRFGEESTEHIVCDLDKGVMTVVVDRVSVRHLQNHGSWKPSKVQQHQHKLRVVLNDEHSRADVFLEILRIIKNTKQEASRLDLL